MNYERKFVESVYMNVATGLLLSGLWGSFAYAHFIQYQKTGEFVFLLLIAAELITIGFYVIRHNPKSVSTSATDWLLAFVGTFVTLLSQPSDTGILPWAKNVMYLGIAIQILGLVSLNRSFALVAAQREIKTKKMYSFIRHPIYASYLITFTAYLLANTSIANAIIYSVFLGCMLLRIIREERHLSLDTSYRDYMSRVRYRLIPGVF